MTAAAPSIAGPVEVEVIVATADRQRILGRRDGDGPAPPRLRLPGTWPPPSSQVPGAVAAETGVTVALLEPLDATVFAAEPVRGEPTGGYAWFDAAAFGAGTVREWLDRPEPATRPAWFRPGWHARAVDWVDATLAAQGARRTGPVAQIRHWTTSSVLCAPTSAGRVFLKAGLPHLAHEPRLIGHLARTWLDAVPQVLAASPEDGWWLSADFGAQPPVRDAAAALRMLARIQVGTVGRPAPLREAGCPTRTLDDLAGRVPALLRRPELWQPSGTPDRARLTRVGLWLQDRCAELDDFDLPLSLVHGDFHQHNAADRPAGPLLFDWSFATVSHPLLDLGGWLHAVGEPDARRHVAAYLEGWRQVAPPGVLLEAWQVARPVAALFELVKFADLAERMGPAYEFDYLPMAYLWARRVQDAHAGRGAGLTGWPDPQ
ncbi:phosphotransferase family protein [Micromonospora olivasterospora]|uniref:Phosphotransferase family enzyme n=1 Tax=Micromonospora olivasterospora TaxID=1880 RepID=A0A562IHS2_MICOL|nr:phosphotransferase [Micromonospora olivasterospora]TWH70442.1 phosphotransferase family enzyme [Micromonospora olivasterospora]